MKNILFCSLVLIPLLSYSFDKKCERSLSTEKKSFRNFEQAQRYAQQNNIRSRTQYLKMKKNKELPDDIPSQPDKIYRNTGWISWGHFLGTNNVPNHKKQFRNFEQAQEYVHQRGITSSIQYYEIKRNGELPDDMPSNPNKTYAKKGWKGWEHFLNTKLRNFEQAQNYVQQRGITSSTQYYEMKRNEELPEDMPYNPDQVYQNKGWVNWKHFLGTEFKNFKQAQNYVQQRGITSSTQYHEMKRNGELPDDIPATPETVYKNKGWRGWKHFLDTEFRSFEDAKEYVQQRNIIYRDQYYEMKRNGELPDDIPAAPETVYKNKGWRGWKHFLGTLKMMKFRKAQDYALNTANIETVEELIEWLKSESRPPNFPEEPHLFYEEWTNARDFLHITRDSNKMTYTESKQFMQSLHFKTKRKAILWLASDEQPEELPIDPHIFYGKEWEGWDTYLGLTPTVKETNGTSEPDIYETNHEEEFISADEHAW